MCPCKRGYRLIFKSLWNTAIPTVHPSRGVSGRSLCPVGIPKTVRLKLCACKALPKFQAEQYFVLIKSSLNHILTRL